MFVGGCSCCWNMCYMQVRDSLKWPWKTVLEVYTSWLQLWSPIVPNSGCINGSLMMVFLPDRWSLTAPSHPTWCSRRRRRSLVSGQIAGPTLCLAWASPPSSSSPRWEETLRITWPHTSLYTAERSDVLLSFTATIKHIKSKPGLIHLKISWRNTIRKGFEDRYPLSDS